MMPKLLEAKSDEKMSGPEFVGESSGPAQCFANANQKTRHQGKGPRHMLAFCAAASTDFLGDLGTSGINRNPKREPSSGPCNVLVPMIQTNGGPASVVVPCNT